MTLESIWGVTGVIMGTLIILEGGDAAVRLPQNQTISRALDQ